MSSKKLGKLRLKSAGRAGIKIHIRQRLRRHRIKIRYLLVAAAVGLLPFSGLSSLALVRAASCPDLKVIFARGSGGEHNTDKNYLAFRDAIRSRLATTHLRYAFEDLNYPAVEVGVTNLGVTLGALVGGGESYDFGHSVAKGVAMLVKEINSDRCPNTQYVVGGYSQGAMVVSKALPRLNSDKLIYAATFGDPKLFLPEGGGIWPAACRGENLSDYRLYVPDCQTYSGLLGGYNPYRPAVLSGRVGTWCNKHDVFCSPYFSLSSHTSYVADNLYEDAGKVIFDKINHHFGLGSPIASPHDTVILIDSTDSMAKLFADYKAEALRLARETLDAGGRVALYDYRDLDDPYQPVQHCDFLTCNMALIESALDHIVTEGGGDADESLLSAAFNAMDKLDWQVGATKSIVVLTDAGYLSPDRDDTTFDQVVDLSKRVDPVNFYIVTLPERSNDYFSLVRRTDGKVVTDPSEFSLLTDYILARYDNLPRVEESSEPVAVPSAWISNVESLDHTRARVEFTNTGSRALVLLNDAILGVTSDTTIELANLDSTYYNTVTIVPLTDTVHGKAVSRGINSGLTLDQLIEAELNLGTGDIVPDEAETDRPDNNNNYAENSTSIPNTNVAATAPSFLPKAPDTGKR